MRTSDVDYRLLEASKAGDLETVKVGLNSSCEFSTLHFYARLVEASATWVVEALPSGW